MCKLSLLFRLNLVADHVKFCPRVIHYWNSFLGLQVARIYIPEGASARDMFKPRTTTGSDLFSFRTSLHIATFILLGIFSPVETISLKNWERSLSGHAKYLLPVLIRRSKTLRAWALYYDRRILHFECPKAKSVFLIHFLFSFKPFFIIPLPLVNWAEKAVKKQAKIKLKHITPAPRRRNFPRPMECFIGTSTYASLC